MQSQERELTSGLFGRLQPFESQSRDGEAEALIKELVLRQPASPYLLVQAVLVQEQALKAAQERIAELEARSGTGPAAGAGFLGNAPKLGPWGSGAGAPGNIAPSPQGMVPRTSVPTTRSPLQAAVAQQAPGGGFLRTAMATAAGVAGGALLFEGIRNLLNSNPGPLGDQQAATSTPPAEPSPSEPQQQAYDQEPTPEVAEDHDTAAYDSDIGGDDDSWA